MKVLSAPQMAALDRRAIEEIGIPAPVLMENAAIGAVDALGLHFPQAEMVTIVAGPGSNGGDGLAMARHLDGRGYHCEVLLVLGDKPLRGDAALQHDILARAGLNVELIGPEDDPEVVAEQVGVACREADVVVDALFGTGLSRPVSGLFAAVIEVIAVSGSPVLAVDLPSGLDGSEARIIGPHLAAELTVTFACPKVAHVLAPAADSVGELVVVDLGLPARLVAEAEADHELIDVAMVAPWLEKRPLEGHKGTFGHALLLAGGAGTAGAAVLAARAAVRGGAGLVTVATPASVRDVVDLGSLESMTVALPTSREGDASAEAGDPGLGAAAEHLLRATLDGKDAVGMGPGLGRGVATAETLRQLALEIKLPLVLDADALNAHAGQLERLAQRQAPTVLTPHPGEMGRLLGCDTAEVLRDRLAAVRRACSLSGAVVVLKGRQTLVAAPGRPVAINPTGNPGMGTGGSGDVLTGWLTALLARGLGARDAACLAVYAHGLAGDLAARERGQDALAAGDLVDALGRACAQIRADFEAPARLPRRVSRP